MVIVSGDWYGVSLIEHDHPYEKLDTEPVSNRGGTGITDL